MSGSRIESQIALSNLRWIIAQNAINTDDLLAVAEPALWTEPCLSLRWRWRHLKEGSNPDKES
jgi:hypothetical protein